MHGFAPLFAAIALAQGSPDAAAVSEAERPPVTPAPAAAPAAPAPAAAPAAAPVPARPPATQTSFTPPPARRAAADPAAERAEAEKVARAFVEALAARDAEALAARAAERFSFDGDTRAGRDAIRAAWRGLLSGREGPPPRVGAVEILPVADAVARLGKPPARIAPLARPGALVAVADVGGRPVVLFLAREGGRMAVLGMHD
jgi:hypothetical protein